MSYVMSRDIFGGKLTGCGVDDRGLVPDRDKNFSLHHSRPYSLTERPVQCVLG